jgi:alpha/beta superfamily hydrolase
VFAGTEDTAVAELIPRTEPRADGRKVRLVVVDGADHFFRDLYSEEIADVLVDLLGE